MFRGVGFGNCFLVVLNDFLLLFDPLHSGRSMVSCPNRSPESS